MSELDPRAEMEKLHDIFEAERQIEEEIGARGRKLLTSPKQGGFEAMSSPKLGDMVGCEWLRIQDTQGTLYIYKAIGMGNGPETQELIYAEDLMTRRCVGRGPTPLMCDAVELMRKHMILDDLADV